MSCTKVKYDSQRDAAVALKLVKKSSSRSHIPRRAYYCKFCKGYHLTSRTQKKH
jgi:hypothetical protein